MTAAATTTRGRRLLSVADLTERDLGQILDRALAFARQPRPVGQPLAGAVVGVWFEQTSTRTRTAFSSGAHRLGAHVIAFGPDDLQTNTGETVADTVRVLSGMVDVLVARTGRSTDELGELAARSGLALVNAMNPAEHPTQALADLTTLLCHFGRIEGLRVVYVGEGNSTAAALALALTRFPGVELTLLTPPGYGLEPLLLGRAVEQACRSGARIAEHHEVAALPSDVDVIYTTRWQTTGTSKHDDGWPEVFAPFRVHAGMWERNPRAVLLHDLPAHRGQEVTAEMLDGPASIAFDQARHKLHSAMAVLEWCGSGAPS